MQLEKTTKEFRNFFLAEFTKEMILNYRTAEIMAFEKIAKSRIRKKIDGFENEENLYEFALNKKPIRNLRREEQRVAIEKTFQPVQQAYFSPKVQEIPQVPSPQSLPQHVQPSALQFGRLDTYINNPSVFSIECEGPGRNVIIKGTNGIQFTGITMSKEEIFSLVDLFSRLTRIPAEEGPYKVSFNNLVFSAIVSEIVEPRFTIHKV